MDSDLIKTPKRILNVSSPLRFVNGQKPLTPNCKYNPYNQMGIGKSTPNTFQRQTGTFAMFKNVFNTPPSRCSKVVNPFEVGLTERLHLPLICSPSLFNCPTPQLSSTLFEWTIDEMSSLNPANFEAHETQFTSTTDPEIEAKAQAAISSFFREHIIVPSPVDCPLRNQKIILSNESFRPAKNTRDGICQTELSLPPNLPKEIEDLLKPYYSQTMNQQQSPAKDCDTSVDHDAADALLRRRLFNQSFGTSTSSISHLELECVSPPPRTPEMNCTSINNYDIDSADSHKKLSKIMRNEESFGSLSPIKLTPNNTLSHSLKHNRSYQSTSSIYRSTPECSLSVICRTSSANSVSMIDDDFKDTSFIETGNIDTDMDMDDKDLTTSSFTDDEKQLSYGHTPNRRKHRYSSRKNLSHSFSCLSGTEFDDSDVKQPPHNDDTLSKTDSGFNEIDDTKNKTGNDCKCPPKSSVQLIHDNMDVDCISPRGK